MPSRKCFLFALFTNRPTSRRRVKGDLVFARRFPKTVSSSVCSTQLSAVAIAASQLLLADCSSSELS
ncbi:hypothetical protein L596_001512 [Steinernema carpocapsae]|uniref:Uncharacterized protein n=1 Tax=Steinernema carpocapsae TaxID=34508 RepID=A0A4U8ULA1_STECR|nr:hypothetical protein L596_001512 [Steinernema carpocapsae]